MKKNFCIANRFFTKFCKINKVFVTQNDLFKSFNEPKIDNTRFFVRTNRASLIRVNGSFSPEPLRVDVLAYAIFNVFFKQSTKTSACSGFSVSGGSNRSTFLSDEAPVKIL